MFLSMSLIDQDHTATYDDIGLIVEAPEANIILTSVWDQTQFIYSSSRTCWHVAAPIITSHHPVAHAFATERGGSIIINRSGPMPPIGRRVLRLLPAEIFS